MPHHVSAINFLVLSVNLIPVPLSLTCLFMLLPHLLTLSTHHSHDRPQVPLSFTPGSKPAFSSNLSHHKLPSVLRTDSTALTGPFLLSISVFIFSFFISLLCLVPCGRLSCFWAHVNILHRLSFSLKKYLFHVLIWFVGLVTLVTLLFSQLW